MRRLAYDKRGFSMIAAVFAITVLMLVGGTMLTVSYSNYARTQKKTIDRQNELYALSAAELLRDGLEGIELVQSRVFNPEDGTQMGETALTCSEGPQWARRLALRAYTEDGLFTFDIELDGRTVSCKAAPFAMYGGQIDTSYPLTVEVSFGDMEKSVTVWVSASCVSEYDGEYEYETCTYMLGRAVIY